VRKVFFWNIKADLNGKKLSRNFKVKTTMKYTIYQRLLCMCSFFKELRFDLLLLQRLFSVFKTGCLVFNKNLICVSFSHSAKGFAKLVWRLESICPSVGLLIDIGAFGILRLKKLLL